MTTVAQLRDRVMRRLEGERTQMIDRLDGAIGDTTTESCTVEFSEAGINTGAVIEIDTELMYVLSRSGTTVTMLRGWNGSTAATHADNSIVYVNPRWTNGETVDLIAEEVGSWPNTIGQVVTDEIEFAASAWIAAVPDDSEAGEIIRILDAKVLGESTATFPQRNRIDVSLIRDRDLDEYTSGYAIQLQAPFTSDRVVQLDFMVEYDLSALGTVSTDLETDVGIRSELMDVVVYGVMWRALSTREAGRTSPGALPSMTGEQVPPTHMQQGAAYLKELRDQRLYEEIRRLNSLYPVLMTTAQS